jgi:hypothetical protein
MKNTVENVMRRAQFQLQPVFAFCERHIELCGWLGKYQLHKKDLAP